MRKHGFLLKYLASFVLSGLLLAVPDALGWTGQAGQAGQDQPQQQQQQAQTFVGKIAQANGALVLKGGYASQDPNNKTTYQLDDQDKAKQFVGKNVKVTGTLDASTNTIHVSNIEEAST